MEWQVVFERRLRGRLEMLAAPARVQRHYLDAPNPMPVDELALEFGDVFGRVREAVEEGVFSHEASAAVTAVDRALQDMSGMRDSGLWTPEALTERPEWAAVRALSDTALKLLPPLSSKEPWLDLSYRLQAAAVIDSVLDESLTAEAAIALLFAWRARPDDDRLWNDALHMLYHYRDDDDIRAKDDAYAVSQRRGLADYVRRLRAPAPEPPPPSFWQRWLKRRRQRKDSLSGTPA